MARAVRAWIVCIGVLGCGPSAPSADTSTGPASSSDEPMSGGSTTGSNSEPMGCAPAPASIPIETFSPTFAAAICAQKLACGCDGDFACEGVFAAQFDAVVAYAGENGLAYDGACAARLLFDTVTARGCALRSEHVSPPCGRCTIFQGAGAEGEACVGAPSPGLGVFAEPCARPGSCAAMTCAPPLPALGPGEACLDGDVALGSCGPGTLCDRGSGTCVETLPSGADCSEGLCDVDAFCNADAVCEARRPAGEPCAAFGQCASSYCPGGQGTCADYVLICELAEIGDLILGPYLLH